MALHPFSVGATGMMKVNAMSAARPNNLHSIQNGI